MSTALGTDFVDAHERHWRDAELLWQHQRWANADQLYGLSAECGLKALMLKFGMQWDHDNDVPVDKKRDKVHTNKVWDRYEAYRGGHPKGAAYALPANNPFDDWDMSQRYAPSTAIDVTRARAHRTGAEWVKQLIEDAEKNGLLP